MLSRMKAMIMAVMLLLAAALPAAAETSLVMFTSEGCPFCKAWERDVGASYDASPYAAKLPLTRVAFNGPAPAGLALNAAVLGTPTFIVVRDGREIGRLEGYRDAEMFWLGLASYAD